VSLSSAEGAYWSERVQPAMGSRAHVVVGDADPALLDWAGRELERLEQCWSRFRADSELARLHEQAGAWTEVSAWMLLALTCASDLHRTTGGLFDPTIRAALEAGGYDRTFGDIAHDLPNASSPAPAPGFDRVEIDVDQARVRFPPSVTIDLGGVGKGLAADLVARGLVERGARSALVSLGGDIRARGDAPDGGWMIPVEHPFDGTRVAFEVSVIDGALVTSTTRVRAWTRGGERHHHIVDPATGESTCTNVAAVVASAVDAWWAEGIAKAVIVAGLHDGIALARANTVRVWCFLEDGEIVVSE
jgi:thiamine biosynthesis lipoprotein